MRVIYRISALLVLVAHLLYVLATMFGGLAVFFNLSWMWLHLPIVIWAVTVNLLGWNCPLTSIEQKFLKAGRSQKEYEGGFVAKYFGQILKFSDNSPRSFEIRVATIIFFWNILVYIGIFLKNR